MRCNLIRSLTRSMPGTLPLSLVVLALAACSRDQPAPPSPPPVPPSAPPAVVETARGTVTWLDEPGVFASPTEEEVEEENPRFGAAHEGHRDRGLSPGDPADGVVEEPVIRDSSAEPMPELSEESGLDEEDAPFEGPGTSGTIGIGGGAGGAFGGRARREADFDVQVAQAAGIGDPLSDKKNEAAPTPKKTWKRSALVPNTSRLSIGDEDELRMTGLQATVRIDGGRARVLLDCFYLNDRDKQLEGRFQLRLPSEASPWYLAFGQTEVVAQGADALPPAFFTEAQAAQLSLTPAAIRLDRGTTFTSVKEARMVPKENAARAYADTTRRRVDPALMEWAGAGVFQARVSPLEPGRLHRIVLGYDVDLDALGEELVYRLDLPAGNHATHVILDLANAGGPATVSLDGGSQTSADGRTRHHFAGVDERQITVRSPIAQQPLLTGRDPTGDYFTVDFVPDLEAVEAAGSNRAVLMIDTSLSSNPERMRIWQQLSAELLANNRDTLEEFAVLCFGVDTAWWREGFAPNDAASARALAEFLDDTALEGATDLGTALRAAASPDWLQGGALYDVFLLSDGAATWGESNAYALSRAIGSDNVSALFAYRTGIAGSSDALLAHLARETGGAVFSVVGEAEIAAASRAHRSRPWRLNEIRLPWCDDLLLAGRPTTIFPGQRLRLAGRGVPRSDAEVELLVSQGGKDALVRHRLPSGIDSPLAARVYGQIATGQLEDFGAHLADPGRAYATHFRVVGSLCSLLMLESEEDYARYQIKPADDAAKIRDTSVGDLVRRSLAEQDAVLGDPKRRTLDWLAATTALEWLSIKLPDGLVDALEALPVSAFDVPATPLRCTVRTWDDVPGGVQEELAARKPTYDTFAAEAMRRLSTYGAPDALEALSSLVEQNPGRFDLARDVGYSALEWNLPDQAHPLFRRVARARPHEPQSYRALGACLSEMGRTELAILYYELALGGAWDGRFGAFRRIAAFDYLRLIDRIERGEVSGGLDAFARSRKQAVAAITELTEADLVVFITWNTDRSDIDLHLIDADGEHCYYALPKTAMGGRLTKDVTEGYGPEMFVLPKAKAGAYKVGVKYFATDDSRTAMRTRVHVKIVQGWGTADASETSRTITLAGREEVQHVASIDVN